MINMNHKIHKSNSTSNNRYTLILIINDNDKLFSHIIFYNYNLQNYYIYVKSNRLEIIKYLETNNICTVSDAIIDWKILTLNTHIILELI
jgi:hypothetical protein